MTENHNTKIEDLECTNALVSTNLEGLKLDELRDVIFDFEYDEEVRLNAFMKWHDEPNDIIFELSNKLCCMYLISGTRFIKTFIISIINTTNIRDIIKIEFAKTLCTKNPTEEHFDILTSTIDLLENSPIVILLECIIMLMKSPFEKHRKPALEYFITIVNSSDHEVHFRYKTILSLEYLLESKDLIQFYLNQSLLEFISQDYNTSTYQILAGQALLQKQTLSEENKHKIQTILAKIMTDEDLDPNVRADAADVLLNLGDGISQESARQMILILGAIDGAVRSVYQDNQNTHNQEIERSALDILECLDSIEKELTYEKALVIINKLATKAHKSGLSDLCG